jgi:phosphoribosylglycinamide formyltransferase-1
MGFNTPMKISFLASHGGSSAKAIIAAMLSGELAAEPGILITNNVLSGIFQWCKDNDFPVHHISSKTHADEDAALLAALQEAGTDIVVCSGYMKKVGPKTLKAFPGRILNIHPSLLPKHGGQGLYGDKVHAAVLAAGETESGATVHIVTAEYDDGPILGQSRVSVTPGDTVETLRRKVQDTEPGLYIDCLKRVLTRP